MTSNPQLYKRVHSRPPPGELTEVDQIMHDTTQTEDVAALGTAFSNYVRGTGPFKDWEEHRDRFIDRHVSLAS